MNTYLSLVDQYCSRMMLDRLRGSFRDSFSDSYRDGRASVVGARLQPRHPSSTPQKIRGAHA